VFAYGEDTDSFGAPAMAADAARVDGATVACFPGVGHFGPLERPAEVAKDVAGALGTRDGTPPS
jgi:pimeloyl-ACP methyl ester carboxylesterase